MKFAVTILLAVAAFFAVSCEIPVIESQDCSEAQIAVREFYSYHFDGDMAINAKELERLKKYMTPQAAKELEGTETENDIFTTNSTDHPKAFRIGSCKLEQPDTARLSVLLFWRSDERTEQREINIEAKKIDGKWLFNKVIR
jgi:hypothetical protein